MIVGHAHVSAALQTPDAQQDGLEAAGAKRVVSEK